MIALSHFSSLRKCCKFFTVLPRASRIPQTLAAPLIHFTIAPIPLQGFALLLSLFHLSLKEVGTFTQTGGVVTHTFQFEWHRYIYLSVMLTFSS